MTLNEDATQTSACKCGGVQALKTTSDEILSTLTKLCEEKIAVHIRIKQLLRLPTQRKTQESFAKSIDGGGLHTVKAGFRSEKGTHPVS